MQSRRAAGWRVGMWAAALSLAAVAAHGQGFNLTSGRNHPEIDWQTAETAHFRIRYPRHLAGIEAEAAAIAEETYGVLSANLGVAPRGKLQIFLSDEDEIVNGFAVAIAEGYTNIWVHVNGVAETWTGREKWLRKVIAHELTHLFHYHAIRSNAGYLAFILANPFPRFWAEGLAQYQTETWDAFRGDLWLRTAVLDDRLSYTDAGDLWNGRLLYAVGNAQVRYFADRYGDSTLAALFAHRRKTLFGLAKVHDFETAFEATTGKPYRAFYDDWRRHVNVYYNTLAAGREPLDSLKARPVPLAGQYYADLKLSPDTAWAALLALTSTERPVQRLYRIDRAARRFKVIAEGALRGPVSWSPDGRAVAFARMGRGRYGALVSDLWTVGRDGGRRRLTRSRRAASPAYAPPGPHAGTLAFVGSAGGTANVFLYHLADGREQPLTRYTGDVQLSSVQWDPAGRRLAVARFAASGVRDILVLDAATGALLAAVGDPAHDNRLPVWSPDGLRLGYTSLRDGVPNVFAYDLALGAERRVTDLAAGATLQAWLPPDSVWAQGSMIVTSSVSKERDRAFRIDAFRTPAVMPAVPIPERFARWTTHRPPREAPLHVAPAPELIEKRGPYRSWANILHAASVIVPYYDDPHDYGLIGVSSWLEPLGKHGLSFVGGVSFARTWQNSLFVASYLNNQFRPSLTASVYRLPGSARLYGNGLLVEDMRGAELTAALPLDWRARPYTRTHASARLRYVGVAPFEFDEAAVGPPLAAPRAGELADVQIGLARVRQRPYRHNAVHPLDGKGARLLAEGSAPVLGADARYLRADAAAYAVLAAPGEHRLFAYGRAQGQLGRALPQQYLGLSRSDEVQIALPGFVPFSFGEVERVRGYRAYAVGDRVLFGSLEYRIPLVKDLQTRLFGVVSFGGAALGLFTDAALVWTGADLEGAVRRVGVGAEVKNAVRVGPLELGHALGVGQPADRLGPDAPYDLYYRIRAAVPF